MNVSFTCQALKARNTHIIGAQKTQDKLINKDHTAENTTILCAVQPNGVIGPN